MSSWRSTRWASSSGWTLFGRSFRCSTPSVSCSCKRALTSTGDLLINPFAWWMSPSRQSTNGRIWRPPSMSLRPPLLPCGRKTTSLQTFRQNLESFLSEQADVVRQRHHPHLLAPLVDPSGILQEQDHHLPIWIRGHLTPVELGISLHELHPVEQESIGFAIHQLRSDILFDLAKRRYHQRKLTAMLNQEKGGVRCVRSEPASIDPPHFRDQLFQVAQILRVDAPGLLRI